MIHKLKILIMIFIIGAASAGNLIKDRDNPMIISNPSVTGGSSTLSFNFQLPPGTKGVEYSQYIAVAFPKHDSTAGNLGTTNFKFNEIGSSICTLYKDQKTVITTSVTLSPLGEGVENIVYCQILETGPTSGLLPLTSGISYRLDITLPKQQQKVAAIFWRNFDVYTTTAANRNGIIIDSGYGFSQGAIFADYKSSSNQILTLEELKKVDAQGKDSSSNSYLYEGFDFRIRLKVNALIQGSNSILHIIYPDSNRIAKLPDTYIPIDVDAKVPTKTKINGVFAPSPGGKNSQYLKGFSDEWIPKGREFGFIIRGGKAGDFTTMPNAKITILLYYKNTNTIQSFTEIDFLSFNKPTVELQVIHPESWEIYMSGAWPLQFIYKIPESSITSSNGVYILLQHAKLIPAFEVWNFVASSCDFSDNTDDTLQFSPKWGERNYCHPLQPDLEFGANFNAGDSSASTGVNGSAIFFKQARLLKNKTYIVRVFGVADVCGKQNSTPDADPLDSSKAATSKTNITFRISIYKRIDLTKKAKFNSNDEIISNTALGPTCWSTFRGRSIDASTPKNGFAFEIYGNSDATSTFGYENPNAQAISYASNNNSGFDLQANAKGDVLMYKEFTDPAAYDHTPNVKNISWWNNGYSYDTRDDLNQSNSLHLETANRFMETGTSSDAFYLNPKKYIGTGMMVIAKSSGPPYDSMIYPLKFYLDRDSYFTGSLFDLSARAHVLFRGDFNISKGIGDTDSKHGLPSPIIKSQAANSSSNNVDGLYGQQPGKIEAYFSKKWFTASEYDKTNCAMSWQVGVSNIYTDHAIMGADILTYGTKAIPGYIQSVFPLNVNEFGHFYNFEEDFEKDPASSNFIASAAPDLRNYYIKGTTMDVAATSLPTSTTIPSTIKIVSIFSNTGSNSPGGLYFTVNPPALGYKKFTINAMGIGIATEQKRMATCTIANKVCSMYFNLYTNCLKWAKASPSNTTLFDNFDVIFRFFPSKNGQLVGNGPNRVIRFVKLFPEPHLFQDGVKKKNFSINNTNPIKFHYTISSSESLNTGTSYQGWGTACLVEIDATGIKNIMKNSDSIAIFLFNLALIEVDPTDASSTYPIGSLIQNANAWGLSSAPPFSRYGAMGSQRAETLDSLSQGWNAAGLISMRSEMSIGNGYTDFANMGNPTMTTFGAYSNSRTSYQFLMGSTLVITGLSDFSASLTNATLNSKISSTVGNQNLFIPTKCPVGQPTGTSANSWYSTPVFYITSMNAQNYNSVNINAILESSLASNPDTLIEYTAKTSMNSLTNGTNKGLMGVRFFSNLNSNSSTSNQLQFFNKSTTTNYSCTAFIFFFSKDIVLDSDSLGVGFNNKSSTTNSMSYYSKAGANPKYFYSWGKAFSQSLIWVSSSDTTLNSNANNDYTNNFILHGVNRPTDLSKWINPVSKMSSYTDSFSSFSSSIAAFCISSTAANQIAVSNLSAIDANGYSFNVSFEGVANTTLKAISVTTTRDKINYNNDQAGNISTSITLPHPVAKLSTLKITSGIFSGNTICGISNTIGNVTECLNISNDIVCVFPQNFSGTVQICCYNLTMKVNPSINSIIYEASGIQTNLTTPPNAIWTYSNSNDIGLQYTFSNSDNEISNLKPSIRNTVYSVYQENALGYVTFEIFLGREPVRDGKIIFEGDFSKFFVADTADEVRCIPSFSSSNIDFGWEKSGDFLIETCDISQIMKNTNSIVVLTKKIVYRCGLSFSQSIFITLTPVLLGKIDVDSNYKVYMKGPGGKLASNDLINNSINLNFKEREKYLSELATKPTVNFMSDVLCPLKFDGVYPRITSSPVDFTFDFDLSTKKTELNAYNKRINSFTIVLPFKYFGDYANTNSLDQSCVSENKKVDCSFSSPGILNISIVNGVNSGTTFSVTLLNVVVGAIDSDYSFLCSVNNVTPNGVLTNLLTGSGKMANDEASSMKNITQPSKYNQTYNLVFYPKTDENSITLRVGVDYNSAWISQEALTIKKTPTFHIFLPPEFEDIWIKALDDATKVPTVKITEYSYNPTTLDETKVEIKTNTSILSRRRLSTTCIEDLVISATHKFWEIAISNIAPKSQTSSSGTFNIAIVNKEYSYLLRTWASAHSQHNENLPIQYPEMPLINLPETATNSVIFTSSRGIKYTTTAKWTLSLNNNTNQMTIYQGRYSIHTWNVVPNASLARLRKNSSGDLLLTDKLFSYPSGAKYTIITNNLSQSIMVGASCYGTNPGKYVVYFKTTNTDFEALPTIFATLVNGTESGTQGTVRFNFANNASSTFPGGSLPGIYTLDSGDTNFDEITGNWLPFATNDKSALITFPSIPPNSVSVNASFSISNASVSLSQIFSPNIMKNNCFKLNPQQVVMNLTEKVPTFDTNSDLDPVTWFKIIDPATDPVLISSVPQKLNGLNFTITPKLFPLNLYCAIVCKNATPPTSEQIRNQSLQTGPLAKQKFYYIQSLDSFNLTFEGLSRGEEYELTCIFETPLVLVENRKSIKVVINSYKSGNAVNKLIPQKVESKKCIRFEFETPPSIAIKTSILTYCQNFFSSSASTPINTGCAICVDDSGKAADGSGFTQNTSCPSSLARRNLSTLTRRKLSTNTTNTTKPNPVLTPTPVPNNPLTYFYDICVFLDKVCPTNLPLSIKPSLRSLQTSTLGLSYFVNVLRNNIGDRSSLQQVLGMKNDLVIAKLSSDDKAPVFTITNGNQSYDKTGKYSTEIKYTGVTRYDCYYLIIQGNTPPLVQDIKGCTDKTKCGSYILSSPGYTITNQLSKPFFVGEPHSIWTVCYNRVIDAKNNSEIKLLYEFLPVCDSNEFLSFGSCKSIAINADPIISSSRFLSFTAIILLMMFFI